MKMAKNRRRANESPGTGTTDARHADAAIKDSPVSAPSGGEPSRRSERLNELLLDSLPHPAMLVRRDRIVLAANRIAREVGAVVGKPCWLEFGHSAYIPDEDKVYLHEHNAAPPCGTHCTFCRADEAFARNQPICTPDVEAYGRIWDLHWIPLDEDVYLHYAIDVTTHKEAEELLKKERDRAQQYLDIAGVVMVVIDAEQRVSLINKKGCKILERSEREVIGRNWFDAFVPERVREDVRGVFAKLMAGETEPAEYFENPVVASDGAERLIAWHNTVLRDEAGQIIATLSSGEDITERRRAEIRLNQTVAELERSNADLDHFARVVSHDLQAPLVIISGYAQLLARRYKGRLDAEADKFITATVDGVERMKALIDDVLAYSRLGTHGGSVEPVACSAVLDTTLANLRGAITESRAAVTADPLPTVLGDASQLTQLFQNLIGNAIKFRSDEPPVVHVRAVRHGQRWLFSVSDNGIGVSPEFFHRIFVMCQRAHSRAEYPGSGIGLTICKKIVERHGGRIWVTSQPGKGSRFYFTIPCMGNE